MDYKNLDRGTFAQINTEVLKNNFKQLSDYCDFTDFICPMVKANAYGHSDVLVAKALEEVGCETMGVGFLEEAIPLRESGVHAEILVFGVFKESSLSVIEELQLTPVLSTFQQLTHLKEHLKKEISVHLKFNTGMNRLGFEVSEVEEIKSYLKKIKNLKVTGVCTHFQCGEDLNNPHGHTQKQLQRYESVLACFEADRYIHHLFNSSSLLELKKGDLYKSYPFGVRPGIALYGYPPVNSTLNLQPVMSLHSQIVSLHCLEKGESVSYGATWVAPKKSLIGVIPMGYADGYHRLLSNQSRVLVGGQACPLIGRVCMDYIMVDLSELDFEIGLGDPVILLGKDGASQITAEEMAHYAQTLSYEILTSVGERVPRILS